MTGRARPPLGLFLSGAGLLVVALVLDRIALGGPLGDAPAWVEAATLSVELAWEALFGTLPRDPATDLAQPRRVLLTTWVLLAGGALYLAACWGVVRRGVGTSPGARAWILAVAVLGRILPLLSPPLLETDPQRYLWDAAQVDAGVNPYRVPPAEVLLALRAGVRPGDGELGRLVAAAQDPATLRALARVNHPQVPTVYPPLAQGLFWLARQVGGAEVLWLKAAVAAVDLLVVLTLLGLLRDLGRPEEWVLLYGWCPLLWKEYAQCAHYDPLAMLACLCALRAMTRGWRGAAGVALGAGVLAKLYPLVLLVALAPRLGRRGVGAALAVTLIGATPYLAAGPQGAAGTLAFGVLWERNAPIFPLVRRAVAALVPTYGGVEVPMWGGAWRLVLDGALVARAACALLLMGWLVRVGERLREAPGGAGAVVDAAADAMAGTLFLSPVVNPWYLGWWSSLAAARGSLAAAALGGTLAGYYASHRIGGWGVEVGGLSLDLRLFLFLPCVVVAAAERAAPPVPEGGGAG